MLKNKCSVWKRIKFPTFWYNCYYFTWSDTYFIQLETLLVNHPLYLYNCWCHNWIEYSLSHCKVRTSEAEDQSWFTLPVLSSVQLVCQQPDVFNNTTQDMTSLKRVIGHIFGVKCQIMLAGREGGSWWLTLQEGFW